MRAAIYARVSTIDQEPENQLREQPRYVEARGWPATEFVDRGVSGTKDRRPALDQMLRDAKRRKFGVLVCWRLDRLGRNLKHLITLLEELQALGIAFASLTEGIDATTPVGKLQMHILGAIAEFERERIRERVVAGHHLVCHHAQPCTLPFEGSVNASATSVLPTAGRRNLAGECDLDRSYVSGLEVGRRNPTYLNLLRIAKAFELPLVGLVDLDKSYLRRRRPGSTFP